MKESGGEFSGDVAAALRRVGEVDLSRISRKLQYDDPDYWTDERIARAEETYRRFLALNLLYPSETLAVNRMLDDYWHAHILDTKKYAEDCDAIFGSMLHHYPYFGLPGEEDEGEHFVAFGVTQEIWEKAFGAPMVRESTPGEEPRLTLDKVLSGLEVADGDGGPDGGPKGCKNGQHCNKIVAPEELEEVDAIAAVSVEAVER